jgi:hypothetical protein
MNKRRPVIIGPNTPNWAKETDVWVNTVDNTLYRYDGSQWDVIGSYGASVSAVGGFTQEQIEDFAAAMLNHANHTNLTASYNDSTGQISLVGASASGGGASLTQEEVQDFVAPLFNHSNHVNASASYNDANNQIIITAPSASGGASLTQEEVQDYAAPLLNHANHTNITVSYDDDNNRILLTAPASGGSAATPSTRGIIYGSDQISTNTTLGYLAGSSLHPSNSMGNILIGNSVGSSITNARNNVAIGTGTLSSLVNGFGVSGQSANVAIGNAALLLLDDTGTGDNVAVGQNAAYLMTGGFENTALGSSSLFSTTTGFRNTAVGRSAGVFNTTGNNNTFIGNGSSGATESTSNAITLGNSSIASLRCQVTSITSLSDERDKTNIEPLPVGLNFINSLNPVKFEWNMRDEGKVGEKDFGFIAQQIIESEDFIDGHDWLKLTLRDNPDKLEATQGRLIPILVKAIQELSAEVEALKSQLA